MNQQRTFNIWIDRYKGLLFKIIRAYTSTDEDANDLFQEISIQVWKSIQSFRGECSPSTWIYRIALNTSIRWSKKENRYRENHGYTDIPVVTFTEDNHNPRLDWLYSQINNMNDIDKSLALLLLDGYAYKEMAEMLGISESHVGVKIHRIKYELTKKSISDGVR